MVADPIDQAGRLQVLFKEGQLELICSGLILAVVTLFGLLVGSWRKRLLAEREHYAEMLALQRTFAETLEKANRENIAREVRVELVLHRTLEVLQAKRQRAKPSTDPAIKLAKEE